MNKTKFNMIYLTNGLKSVWQHPTDPTNFYENDHLYESFKLISDPSDNILNDKNEVEDEDEV